MRPPRLCKRGIGTGQMLPDTALVTQRRERSHLALVRRFQKRTRGVRLHSPFPPRPWVGARFGNVYLGRHSRCERGRVHELNARAPETRALATRPRLVSRRRESHTQCRPCARRRIDLRRRVDARNERRGRAVARRLRCSRTAPRFPVVPCLRSPRRVPRAVCARRATAHRPCVIAIRCLARNT